MDNNQRDQLCINTIRTLAMDAVQQANSGHPGTPMALAPVAYCLWQQFLRFDPDDPIWPNRDRFVLSNGHASMLLYALLHLARVKAVDPMYETLGELSVTLADIKHFRQLESKCPGHPEYHLTSGVETTTGPLGQGVATSVGMAMARWWLAQYFNRPDFELFNYNVYVLCTDLFPSTKTRLMFTGAGDFRNQQTPGRNFHFGVREHAMCAIVKGLALAKLRPYGATFLIFSDYAKPAIRLGALMELPVIDIFTHDSIGLGEDGPTHQPVEQLTSLRAVPGLIVLRPADANEVVECWKVIMQLRHQPVALILTRQAVPTLDRSQYAPASGVTHGAYVLAEAANGKPDVVLLATGSEVSLCVAAYEQLTAEGIQARVVSMPSWELFEQQSQEYRDTVLPPAITARVSVEQASSMGWDRYVGFHGRIIGMHTFGASAPLKALLKKFGFVPESIVAAAKEQVAHARARSRAQ